MVADNQMTRSPARRRGLRMAQPMPRPDAPPSFETVTPQPTRSMVVPTPEEYAAWASHPVTEWVARCYAQMAEAQQAAWLTNSWQASSRTPEDVRLLADMLIELRTRADAYRAFIETNWRDYVRASRPK